MCSPAHQHSAHSAFQFLLTSAFQILLISSLHYKRAMAIIFQLMTQRALWTLIMLALSSSTGIGLVVARPVQESAAGLSSLAQLTASLCATSGLVCLPKGNWFNSGLESAERAAVLRDMSIESINDLQKDFFLESALELGGEMHLDTNLNDPIPARAFLTAADAAKVPELKLPNVPRILAHFGVAPSSDMATAIGTSAFMCGNPALPGEARACPLSLEAMGSFVKAQLGTPEVEVIGTHNAPMTAPASKAPVRIVGVKKGSLAQGKRIVVCHHIALPVMAYYCHSVTGTKVVKVDLKDAEGAIIKGVSICHMDTSMWLSTHPAFAALRIPKGATACHALVQNDLVFAPASKCSDAIPA